MNSTVDDSISENAVTYNVSSSQELTLALSNATGGDTILLAGGDYGDIKLNDFEFANTVTIKSASDVDRAEFSSLYLNSVSNITFDSIDVNFIPDEDTVAWSFAAKIKDSSDVQLINSTIEGGPAVNGVPPETDIGSLDATQNITGLATGRGLIIENSNDITLENNEISEFHKGIVAVDVDGLTMVGNEIYDLRTSPLVGAGVSNVLLDGNYFHDSTPWNLGGAGDHGDFVHFWLNEGQESNNLTFVNNVFEQGDGAAILGVFLEDNGFDDGLGFSDVTFENNIIFNGAQQGLRLENVDGLKVVNNTFLQSSGDENDGPTVVLKDGTQNVLIENNVLSSEVVLDVPKENLDSITLTNNLQVQAHDSQADNYIGDLYSDPMASNATYLDLKVLPDGLINSAGVGSTLSELDLAPNEYAGAVVAKSGTGFDLQTHNFDISNVYDEYGKLDLSSAEIVWDFGDGSTGTDMVTDHNYEHPGSYEIKATLTLENGQIVTVAKSITVKSPIVLDANFDNNANDNSNFENEAVVGDNVTFETGRDGSALRLNGDTVEFKKSSDFFNNAEYTIMFDFKKDVGNEGASGSVIKFVGGFNIVIKGDGIEGSVTTDKGTVRFSAKDLGISDSDWHRIELMFSGKDGTAILYLDGKEVHRIEGLEGAVQTGLNGQSVYIGNPWGEGFPGLIDNLGFLQAAIDPEDAGLGLQALTNKITETNETPAVEDNSQQDTQAEDNSAEETTEPTPNNTEIIGTQDADSVLGTDAGDYIETMSGDDYVHAGGGDDEIHGGAGRDQLFGDDGADVIYGGAEADRLFGQSGNDTLYGENGNDKLVGGSGDDRLFGGAGDDFFFGDDGNDTLDGGAGRDRMWAGAGNDTLTGGDGDDNMLGEAGDDVLVGGAGRDRLTGGDGADEFVFGVDSGRDTILDFNVNEDTITLKGLEFDSAEDVIANAYYSTSGKLMLHLDNDGSNFSWSTSNYVHLAGLELDDLSSVTFELI